MLARIAALMLGWLSQPITLPLWAYLASLLLPAAFFAGLAKRGVKQFAKQKLGVE